MFDFKNKSIRDFLDWETYADVIDAYKRSKRVTYDNYGNYADALAAYRKLKGRDDYFKDASPSTEESSSGSDYDYNSDDFYRLPSKRSAPKISARRRTMERETRRDHPSGIFELPAGFSHSEGRSIVRDYGSMMNGNMNGGSAVGRGGMGILSSQTGGNSGGGYNGIHGQMFHGGMITPYNGGPSVDGYGEATFLEKIESDRNRQGNNMGIPTDESSQIANGFMSRVNNMRNGNHESDGTGGDGYQFQASGRGGRGGFRGGRGGRGGLSGRGAPRGGL